MNKIYLGQYKGTRYFIEKHKFDCNWYWGFGYIGNSSLHTHFNYVFMKDRLILADDFDCNFSASVWWQILEAYKTAYVLKECADLYYRGGSHLTYIKELELKNIELSNKLNKELVKVLDYVWELMLNNRLDKSHE